MTLPKKHSLTELLDALKTSYDHYSQAFIQKVLPQKPFRLLEIGCGTAELANWLQDNTHLESYLGIDTSESILLTAQKMNQSLNNKIEFKQLSVYDLNRLDSPAFDVIYERFVMVDLTNPIAALKSIHQKLKPGGLLICESIIHSHGFSSPKSAGLERFLKLIIQAYASQGKEADIGKDLYELACNHHFSLIEKNVSVPVIQKRHLKTKLLPILGGIFEMFEQMELADSEELQKLKIAIEDELPQKGLWFAPTLIQFAFKKNKMQKP